MSRPRDNAIPTGVFSGTHCLGNGFCDGCQRHQLLLSWDVWPVQVLVTLVLFRELMEPGFILLVGSQSLGEYGDDSWSSEHRIQSVSHIAWANFHLAAVPLWLSARLVSWDLTGTGHSEIVVDLEVSWLSDRSHHVGLVFVLFAPPCWPLDWDADVHG